MHILTKLKMELKAAVEAGGPSEETFYKEWDDKQRKDYINEHPQSKFAQKENNKNVENKENKGWKKSDALDDAIQKNIGDYSAGVFKTDEGYAWEFGPEGVTYESGVEKTRDEAIRKAEQALKNREKYKNSKPAKAPARPKSKEYKDSYDSYKKGYEKYHDPDNSDDLHDAIFESFLIDLDDQSGCDTSDVDIKDVNDLIEKKISIDDFVKKYGGEKATDNNKGELDAILDHFNPNIGVY